MISYINLLSILFEHKFYDKWKFFTIKSEEKEIIVYFVYIGKVYIHNYKKISVDLNLFMNSEELITYLDTELKKMTDYLYYKGELL